MASLLLYFFFFFFFFCFQRFSPCSGESGSGKSEQFKHSIDHLIALSTHRKSTRVQQHLLSAQTIINCFTHAKTTVHDNASRSATFIEVHFSERGRLSGAVLMPYALEKTRVTSAGTEERNFHVFYCMLAGASLEDRNRLGLSDWSTFNYLSRTTTSRASSLDDTLADADLRQALKTILSSSKQPNRLNQIYQVLAAILHLGNLQFIEDPSNAQDAAFIKNTDTLLQVAELLGVDPNALSSVLTFKSKLIKRDITTLFLDPEHASRQRDDLAQSLYCLLFTWLVEQMNQRLTPKNAHSFISLLDVPGWITKHPSQQSIGFDQLTFHFIHETLYQFVLTSIFERDRQEYIEQGVSIGSEQNQWPNNTATVDLLVHPSKGLWSIMNAQASRQMQNGRPSDDDTFMDHFASANRSATLNNSGAGSEPLLSFKKSDTGSRLFSIQHFWGQSTYDPRLFTERNQDYLCNDFIALFKGNAYSSPSTNSLVVSMFNDSILGQDDGTRNRVFSQQQAIRPLRSPNSGSASYPVSKSMDKSSSSADQKTSVDVKSTLSNTPQSDVFTIADLLVTGISDLTQALSTTLPWSVLCMRPNELSLSNSCDVKKLSIQQSHFKIQEIIKRVRCGYYTTVFNLDEFWDRYHLSIPLTVNTAILELPPAEKCQWLAQTLGWNEIWMATGKSKVSH
jgi:chitin synthase